MGRGGEIGGERQGRGRTLDRGRAWYRRGIGRDLAGEKAGEKAE